MIGENDGPSMISYATSGATYGYGFFLPFIVATFGAAIICQEMCMRLGAVTHRGYGELVIQRYGRIWGFFNAGDLVLTNLVTLVAEFVALRIGLAYFHLPAWVAVAFGLALVAFSQSGHRYWRWERIALGLAAFNGLFLLAAIVAGPSWGATGKAFVTLSPFPSGSFNTMLLLVASTIGATVTPWMIFFQQSATVDKGMTPRDLKQGRTDTVLGGVLAALFGCGALVVGAVLATHHAGGVQGLAGAGFPGALRHVSGALVATLFALGLVEAGALALLTISASTGYAVGEALGVHHSFNYSLRRALAVLCLQHRRGVDRRCCDPDPRRAAAVDRLKRQRAGHRAVAGGPGLSADAGQRPPAHGPLGQQAQDQRGGDRRRGGRGREWRRLRHRLVPADHPSHPLMDDSEVRP